MLLNKQHVFCQKSIQVTNLCVFQNFEIPANYFEQCTLKQKLHININTRHARRKIDNLRNVGHKFSLYKYLMHYRFWQSYCVIDFVSSKRYLRIVNKNY